MKINRREAVLLTLSSIIGYPVRDITRLLKQELRYRF